MKSFMWIIAVIIVLSGTCLATWTFTDVNAPGSSSQPDFYNSSIDWRPQGDYALIAGNTGLYRYEYPSGALSFHAYSSADIRRVRWAPDGSYAVVTGGEHIYRYEHSASGFGTLTEITDIQGSATYDITFFDVVFNPVNAADPPYIGTNRQSGSDKQLVIFRYDPAASPQVYWDYSGGLSLMAGSSKMSYQPVSMAFQADGDYIVIANAYGLNSQGVHVYDPDQSTFPVEATGAMQYYGYPGDIGNARAVEMSPVSGTRFVLLKGNGMVVRLVEHGLPADFVEDDTGAAWYTGIMGGEISYSYNGGYAIALERQQWSPNHIVMLFAENGDFIQHLNVVSAGFTNEEMRLTAIKWHPFAPIGLIGGQHRWLFKFETDSLPYPLPTATPTATVTPTPVPVPATHGTGLILLLVFCGMFVAGSVKLN